MLKQLRHGLHSAARVLGQALLPDTSEHGRGQQVRYICYLEPGGKRWAPIRWQPQRHSCVPQHSQKHARLPFQPGDDPSHRCFML
jgi:hypothetical protein